VVNSTWIVEGARRKLTFAGDRVAFRAPADDDGAPRMALDVSEARACASRVAKIFVARARPRDAVDVLAAWAAAGPNDTEGQALLAEALQIDPRSPMAQLAFERMEGIQGNHDLLEQAIQKYAANDLEKLEKDLTRPAFRRAQVGFNNNLRYKGQVYHVQTEDSGLDKPHVVTHLFADGGRIIKSFKRTYAEHVSREDVVPFVRQLMKGQQMEMVLCLRDGLFDGIIDGRERGGMDMLEQPPNVDVQRIGGKKEKKTEPKIDASLLPDEKGPVRFRLNVLRSLKGGADHYEARGDDIIVGPAGDVKLEGERFCHPREVLLKWRAGKLVLEDLDGGNGAFLRIRAPVELAIGDEFVIGDQLLRIDKTPVWDLTPGAGPTYCYSSPVWPSSFRVLQILEGGGVGGCVLARGMTLHIGSAYNDMIIGGDPLVQDHHCLLDEQAGTIVLTDLESKTGVFVRIQGVQELRHGDELLIGRTRLGVDMNV
jgi:hypothetical protein